MNQSESLVKYLQDYPGQDFRHSPTWDRIRKMGWKQDVKFEEGLRETVD
jgi:dTDP-D-glucose 4,6-dehydratase